LTAAQPQPVPSPQPQTDPDRCQQVNRRRRRKGQCRQGYFRETANSTQFVTWSKRKCPVSSKKKPPSRPV
jgi:hypothetical protein